MLIQPRPNPVITITSAPIIACGGPDGADITAARSMWGIVRTMKTIVIAPVAQVRIDCSFMIV